MANAIVKTVVTLVDTSRFPNRHDDTISEHHCIAFLYTDQVFYALNEDKVCRGLALMLLQNAVKFNLREFQEVWQQSVPEGMSTRLDQLKVSTLKKTLLVLYTLVVSPVFRYYEIVAPFVCLLNLRHCKCCRVLPWWTAPPTLRPSAYCGWRIFQRTHRSASTTSSRSGRNGRKMTSHLTYSRCCTFWKTSKESRCDYNSLSLV